MVAGENAERNQLSFDVGYEARLGGDPRRVLSFQGGIAAQEFDLLLPSLEGLPPARLATAAHDSYAQARYRHGDPRRSLLEVRASWSGFDSDSVPTAFYQPFELRTDTVDLDVHGVWDYGEHALTAGVGYRLSAFETGSFDVSPGRQDVHQGWVFAQDELRFDDVLTLTFGARIDQHSVTDASLSPRAAAVLRLLEGRYVFSDWFSSFGNYAFSRRSERGSAGERNEQAPENKVNLGTAFSGERVEAMVWAHYYDATQLFGQDVASYLLVNASVSYRFDLEEGASGRLYVRAFNLLDDDHREHPEGDS